MILGLALGWLLGIGTAILMLQFAAAALADDLIDDLDHTADAAPAPPPGPARRRSASR
jgi:hypothetical protein